MTASPMTVLTRDCPATTVPYGESVTLDAGGEVQVVQQLGGSITVRNDGDTLTLVASTAAAGFTTEVKHSSGGHVEVRFESDAHRTDARVDLVNGTMTNNFTESPR